MPKQRELLSDKSYTISVELAQQIDRALSKAMSHMIAMANTTPYPDDPRWSPWTRWQKPLSEQCGEARKALREAIRDAKTEKEAGS
jgi:hypothetical protein